MIKTIGCFLFAAQASGDFIRDPGFFFSWQKCVSCFVENRNRNWKYILLVSSQIAPSSFPASCWYMFFLFAKKTRFWKQLYLWSKALKWLMGCKNKVNIQWLLSLQSWQQRVSVCSPFWCTRPEKGVRGEKGEVTWRSRHQNSAQRIVCTKLKDHWMPLSRCL